MALTLNLELAPTDQDYESLEVNRLVDVIYIRRTFMAAINAYPFRASFNLQKVFSGPLARRLH